MKKIQESQLSYDYERRLKNLKYLWIELLKTLNKDRDTWGKPGTTYVSYPVSTPPSFESSSNFFCFQFCFKYQLIIFYLPRDSFRQIIEKVEEIIREAGHSFAT